MMTLIQTILYYIIMEMAINDEKLLKTCMVAPTKFIRGCLVSD